MADTRPIHKVLIANRGEIGEYGEPLVLIE